MAWAAEAVVRARSCRTRKSATSYELRYVPGSVCSAASTLAAVAFSRPRHMRSVRREHRGRTRVNVCLRVRCHVGLPLRVGQVVERVAVDVLGKAGPRRRLVPVAQNRPCERPCPAVQHTRVKLPPPARRRRQGAHPASAPTFHPEPRARRGVLEEPVQPSRPARHVVRFHDVRRGIGPVPQPSAFPRNMPPRLVHDQLGGARARARVPGTRGGGGKTASKYGTYRGCRANQKNMALAPAGYVSSSSRSLADRNRTWSTHPRTGASAGEEEGGAGRASVRAAAVAAACA